VSRTPESERSDWTEQDLLTREEAAVRVRREIAASVERLNGEPLHPSVRELEESRLRALRDRLSDSDE
jgi:hypothetical protein